MKNKTDINLIFESYIKNKALTEDNDQYAPEDAPEDDQFEGMEPEEDESVGDSSDFEDKAEKFADSIGDAELEYLVNLSGEEFERLKGFLQDQMGYRDLGQYKLN